LQNDPWIFCYLIYFEKKFKNQDFVFSLNMDLITVFIEHFFQKQNDHSLNLALRLGLVFKRQKS